MPEPQDNRAFQPFAPAGPGDSRSPCPALNSLANHSYIPHSGRSIAFGDLVYAVKDVYNMSTPLALLLAIVGFVWCGHLVGSGFSTRLELDLHDLSRHNRIEHDGSMGHADTAPGAEFAPSVPDKSRIANMLAAGSARTSNNAKDPVNALSILDFARVRYSLDLALRKPLDIIHAEIARGEIAMTLLVLGVHVEGSDAHDTPVVPKERIRQWYQEERLPTNWSPPKMQVGLLDTMTTARKVKADVARLTHYSQFH